MYGALSYLDIETLSLGSGVSVVGERAMYYCQSLVSANLSSVSTTSLPKDTFSEDSSLRNLVLPSNLQSIGDYALNRCASLTSINLPSTLTSIGTKAFQCVPITTISLPSGLKTIGQYAFNECEELTSFVVPDSVTSIGRYAFMGCVKLESITLPFLGNTSSSNRFFGYIFGANSYSQNSNYVPSSLEEVILSNACTSIPDYAFYGCSNITSITIPDSVNQIGNYAFAGCSVLSSVAIGNGVTSIGNYAFQNCTSLVSVIIPINVQSIGQYSFEGCASLEGVYYCGLPFDLSIGSNNSKLLSTIYYYSASEPTDASYNYWHYVNGLPTIW